MPNWCANRVSVFFPGDGDVPGERLVELREFVATDVEPFSFRRILPVPDEIENDSDGMAGYDWRVNNWGAKWDVHDVHVDETSDRSVDFLFDTAWSPAFEVIVELSRRFPDATVGLAYDEPGMDFGGYEIYRNGETLDGREGGSRSSSWADLMEWSGVWG
jgi:hypothetical protein